MRDSAVSRSPSRISAKGGHARCSGVVGVLMGLVTAGCPTKAEHEPTFDVRSADASWIDDAVVREIASRDGVDLATARARAEDTLRLARARVRELERDDVELGPLAELSPTQVDNLARTQLARTWLSEGFEPTHQSQDIPRDLVAQNLESPKYFHPRVHVVCNVMIVSSERDTKGRIVEAPDDPAWRDRARHVLRPITSRLHAWLPDPATERSCKLLKQLVGEHERIYDDGRLTLRIESGVMDVCRRDRWDEGFVDALCEPADSPGWYGPFDTRYGVHMVAVLSIKPETLPAAEERESILRDAMLNAWRTQMLDELLARDRAAKVRVLADPVADSDVAP